MSSVRAAPHCPTGHFSPYSDGEKDATAAGFRQPPTLQNECRRRGHPLLPVTIRGEGAGRRMRGGADVSNVAQAPGDWDSLRETRS
ncbi:hypothetical protein EN858_03305 [Mesorhizobium sp. M4B.F.Ca.ET.215.01.1.1]|nr:hypothetical protein EOA34_24365 [Mesorhizobium sp. M4B.F.Ca.ET.013.02.1.1]RUW70797.1 hypothetical protein EOA31_19440 [Mesorhizobium sp. M4B.F.Ca.ET.049.02.1.2]RVD25412.1 hypothetical protein EN738_14290 [Mesorhizobium sp. M4B.F.Ca.ET.017.02.2.1]RVD36255.1 hypothetical protein EN741_26110 [Mesorhizobium sp. M4B.F.Ca.ET.019.03.1.1]RWF67085.1 MAG: hypothetical protein EOS47_03490 [Mesorhizobium sp.]TGQ18974.1 hypothetical protein EN858_03305 [Mesorhizobium sp. M4B.F.Ca.ET.215.01.1.1]TGQ4058